MTPASVNRYADFVSQYPYESPSWQGKVTACISHPVSGWILLWICSTSYLQNITIHISAVFDPFLDLILWLETIAQGQFSALCRIDEEGIVKDLIAHPLDGDLVDFQIVDPYTENEEILFRMRASRRQLVTEFVSKLELFLQSYYQIEEWEHGVDLAKLDFSKLHDYLQSK